MTRISEMLDAATIAGDELVYLLQSGQDRRVTVTNLLSGLAGAGGDITGVTAGAGLTGGGTTGAVTLNVSFGAVSGTAAQGNDSRIVNAVNRTGDTMTGLLTLSGAPTVPLHAATKAYVDTSVGAAGGGTITGVTAGTGLTGGGTTGTVTLTVSYGTTAGTAAQGNDTRITGALQAATAATTYAPLASPTFTGTVTATGSMQLKTVKIGTAGWLEAVIAGTETAVTDGIVALSKTGQSGGVYGTRASDSALAGAMNFALGGFAINNNTTQLQTNYCAYFEGRRLASTGTVQGLEVGMVNAGDVHDAQPYFMGDMGSTLSLWLSAGRTDTSPNNDISAAIGIVGGAGAGSAKFRKGIVFQGTSLATQGSIGGVAMALPVSTAVTWYSTSNVNGTGVPTAYIRSSISDATGFTTPTAIDFNGTGLDIVTTDGTAVAGFKSGQIAFTGALSLSTANTGIDIGAQGISNTPFVDFHSSTGSNDYDVRLVSGGGTAGSNGTGTLTIAAGTVSLGTSNLNLGSQTNAGSSVAIAMNATGSGTDLKRSQIFASGAQVVYQLVNDASTATANYLTINRSASAGTPIVSSIDLGAQTTVPDLNIASTGYIGTAWTSDTATPTAASGTFTTVSCTRRYKKVGRIVHIQISVTITTNGTAAGSVLVPLPFAAAATSVLAGREIAVSGKMISGTVSAAASTLSLLNYDNTYPGANSASIILTGVYESST